MTDEPTLHDIATAIHMGLIYSSLHLMAETGPGDDPEQVARDLRMVFLPLMVMVPESREQLNEMMKRLDMPPVGVSCELPEDIGMFWQWMARALPRSINGRPMFASCHVLSKAETEKVRKLLLILYEKDKATTPQAKADLELKFWNTQ